MRKINTILYCLFFFVVAHAQEEIALYPGKIPNAYVVPDPERMVERGKNDRAFFDTAIPTLTIFRPEHPNGKAIIICPGGAYLKTTFDKEGTLVAKELIKNGTTAFVLKYRIPQDLTNINKSMAPLQDAQQAIRLVRKHAADYQINPSQIGIMGFSAGGHLAASAATHFTTKADANNTDTTSVRPDFVILIYPVISFKNDLVNMTSRNQLIGENPEMKDIIFWSNEEQVTTDAPPAFLVHCADDKAVPVGNSLAYYTACIEKGVSAEMHLYPTGGHGFGMYNNPASSGTTDAWINRLENWLNSLFPSEVTPKQQVETDEKFTIENCVNAFDAKKTVTTKTGFQYWFVDKNFIDGRTLKMSVVEPHQATHAPHTHEGDEFFFVLEGTAEFHLNGKTTTGGALTSFYCPPNSIHGIRNVGDTKLKYLVIKKYSKDKN